jgi:hypothetical protein
MGLHIKKYLFRKITTNRITTDVNIYYRYNKNNIKEYITVPTYFNSGHYVAFLASNNDTLYDYLLTKYNNIEIHKEKQPILVARTLCSMMRVPLIIVTDYYSNISTKEDIFEIDYINQEDVSIKFFRQFIEP